MYNWPLVTKIYNSTQNDTKQHSTGKYGHDYDDDIQSKTKVHQDRTTLQGGFTTIQRSLALLGEVYTIPQQ